jgi:hypothetical protein
MAPYLRDARLGEDPDAVTIRGVESESDALPLGSERVLWSATALVEKDAVAREYSNRVRPMVFAACEAILRKL